MSDNLKMELGLPLSTSIKPDPDAELVVPRNTTAAARVARYLPRFEPGRTYWPFNKFPKEIRELVWASAACEPRIIEVTPAPNEILFTCQNSMHLDTPAKGHCLDDPEFDFTEIGWSSDYEFKALAPATLHVCHESRHVGQRFYEGITPPPYGSFRDTYINWASDVFIFDDPELMGYFLLEANRHILCGKVVRLGLAGAKDVDQLIKYYQPAKSAESIECPRRLQEIVIIPSRLRLNRFSLLTSLTLTSVDKHTVEMTDWYNRLQGVSQLPQHLKDSIKFQYIVNSRKVWRKTAPEIAKYNFTRSGTLES